jgi:hypothetical protein
MEGRKFTREFKLEAVRLKERGVSFAPSVFPRRGTALSDRSSRRCVSASGCSP